MNTLVKDIFKVKAEREVRAYLYGQGSSIVEEVIDKYLSQFSLSTQYVIDIVEDREVSYFIANYQDASVILAKAERQLVRAVHWYIEPGTAGLPNRGKPTSPPMGGD